MKLFPPNLSLCNDFPCVNTKRDLSSRALSLSRNATLWIRTCPALYVGSLSGGVVAWWSTDTRELIPAVYSPLLSYHLCVCHDQVSLWKCLLLSNVLRSSSALVLSIFPSFMNISSRASVTSVGILCEFLQKKVNLRRKSRRSIQKDFKGAASRVKRFDKFSLNFSISLWLIGIHLLHP